MSASAVLTVCFGAGPLEASGRSRPSLLIDGSGQIGEFRKCGRERSGDDGCIAEVTHAHQRDVRAYGYVRTQPPAPPLNALLHNDWTGALVPFVSITSAAAP